MNTIVLYASIHHGNTRKIAKVISKALDANLIDTVKDQNIDIKNYDLVGFGSGIYFYKHHKSILEYIDTLPKQNKKSAFIFSTSGMGAKSMTILHKDIKKKLQNKGFEIVGEYACGGWDTYGPYKLVGGLQKGHPDEKDIDDAKKFADQLIKELQ